MAGAAKRRAKAQNAENHAQKSESKSADNGQNLAATSQPEVANPDQVTSHTPEALDKYDGNRDPTTDNETFPPGSIDPLRLRGMGDSIGLSGWYAARGLKLPEYVPKRNGYNNVGKETIVGLNMFDVLSYPSKFVFQYDITIGNGQEKRGLIKSIWHSDALQSKIGKGWLFDGNKIAWSLTGDHKVQSKNLLTTIIDMDAEKGLQVRESRKGKNTFQVHIRQTKKVHFELLHAHLENGAPMSNEITEAVIFLDHLMREWPGQRLTQIKKSFFRHGQKRSVLGGAVEAFKGVFSSIKIVASAQCKPSLSVNVDVANGTFFTTYNLRDSCCHMLGTNPEEFNYTWQKLRDDLHWERSSMKKALQRFAKVGIYVLHRGKDDDPADPHPTFVIDKIIPVTAEQHRFEVTTRDNNGEVLKREWVTMREYFKRKYNLVLQSGLPLVKMTKKDVVLPMEICKLQGNQRYPYKLTEKQTAQMIKFAVTLPKERWQAVEHGLEMLDWNNDMYLKNYGLRINPKQVKVKARLLPPPTVQFGGAGAASMVGPNQTAQGRWQLVGKKFMACNTLPLKSWGVCAVRGRGECQPEAIKRFFKQFVDVYGRHGGNIAEREPIIEAISPLAGDLLVAGIWNATGNKRLVVPQILFFVVPDRNSVTYTTIKRLCETRFGCVSQVLQSAHVNKCQDQYISNVCMKVNAKLGGYTSEARGIIPRTFKSNPNVTTMCLGGDVSHPAPGMDKTAGSFAAITMSLNLSLTRYAACVNTNGHRLELITPENISAMLLKMVKHWMGTTGQGALPRRVIYFRDGVAQEQYTPVLEREVVSMKEAFDVLHPKNTTKWIVVVASKRHHVRFFPDRGDKNGNPVPGTLVETGCTDPFGFDFYLNAHSAIKGTSRPVHYHVLMNEPEMPQAELQQLIFEHSFQYVRSTTPVSIFPAIYYAHIASQRAKCHVPVEPPQTSGKKDTQPKGAQPKKVTVKSTEKTPDGITPLARMIPGSYGTDMGMWYI
ncbi:Piwi-domain-containing protein [Saccharata proteae CBS 121410]|uniref:Piwi-domain-containing protein n=1 Tax=Saccharata proteae CBS 121410 TaxID=1314787 RepID=A0A9P4HUR7_9PEZI|nr:Piwi-domain-containing protein [Saccharata proteae CBS 121410]